MGRIISIILFTANMVIVSILTSLIIAPSQFVIIEAQSNYPNEKITSSKLIKAHHFNKSIEVRRPTPNLFLMDPQLN